MTSVQIRQNHLFPLLWDLYTPGLPKLLFMVGSQSEGASLKGRGQEVIVELSCCTWTQYKINQDCVEL